MAMYDDFSFDYFDYLRGVPCNRTQEELGGSQLLGEKTTHGDTGQQEGAGTQPSPGRWPEALPDSQPLPRARSSRHRPLCSRRSLCREETLGTEHSTPLGRQRALCREPSGSPSAHVYREQYSSRHRLLKTTKKVKIHDADPLAVRRGPPPPDLHGRGHHHRHHHVAAAAATTKTTNTVPPQPTTAGHNSPSPTSTSTRTRTRRWHRRTRASRWRRRT
jgi:hypothetical protein